MPCEILPPPLVHRARGGLPVLLSVPHAGRDYPAWLVALANGGRASLEPLEDPLVDRLAAPAITAGIAAVVARTPRAAIDCNRGEDEIDPLVVAGSGARRTSARARGGLGIVPGRTAAHGTLWRHPITRRQLDERIAQAHRPYHAAIAAELEALANRFGGAILLDCHSMPPPPPGGHQVILGDRYGRSAAGWVTSQAMRIVSAAGFTVGVNDPFAGGHIVERHGAPGRDVHALQVELDRRIYLGSDSHAFDRVAALLHTLAENLSRQLLDRQLPAAAE